MVKKKGSSTINLGILFPRTSVWLLISFIFLTIDLVISFVCFCEFVDYSSWRWVVCGIGIFYALGYLILIFVNFYRYKRRIWSNKKDDSFITSVETQHFILGFITFAFVSILWASFMGIKRDVQFLITVSISNYIKLQSFYLLNVVIVFINMIPLFNYPVDVLDRLFKKDKQDMN